MTPPTRFERHPLLTLSLLVLLAVPLTDLAFTAVWRARHPEGPSSTVRTRSEVVHHGLRPRSRGEERWGPWVTSYEVNSLGFRDASTREVPLRGTRPRLLLIGDSFTEGIGVPYASTFAGRLARELDAEGWEVLNAGTASYCPIIYERRVRQLLEGGLAFDELAVFIDIGDIQDEVTYKAGGDGSVVSRERRRIQEERANRRHDGWVEELVPLQRFLEKHTLLLGLLYHRLVVEPRREPARRAALWTVDPRLQEEYGREGLDLARRHMDSLAALLAPRGIHLTVGVYPWPDHLVLGDRDSLQARTWREWARGRGASFVDLFPDFFALGPPREVVERYFIGRDIHWNAEGHRVVADGFLRSWRARHPAPAASVR